MISLDFLNNDYADYRSDAEKIEENIAIDILTGSIAPGRKLSEEFLCEKYSIGRTPMREILRNLCGRGLIELIPNRGAFAKPPTRENVDDLMMVKCDLLPHIVGWAIERISKEELEALEETFSFMEFYTATAVDQDDLEKVLKITRGFWSIIYDACGNRHLASILSNIDFIVRYSNSDILYPKNYLAIALEEHKGIIDGFRKRQAEIGTEAAAIYAYQSMLRRK